MNKSIYILVSAVIGAAIGGGCAYFYLNKKYDVVFDKETESYRDEIESLREENTSLHKRLVNKLGKDKAEFFENEHVADDVPDEMLDISEEDEEDDDEGYDSEPTKKDGTIRFIYKKDYEDDDDYEKETFEYYMANSIIVQDNDILEPEEFEEVCGTNALPLLRKDKSLSRWSSAGDNELYIRNENFNVDYKIKRYHMAFGD